MSEHDAATFRRFERRGWNRVAHRYHDAWSALTGPFVEPLLDAADAVPGRRLLDVASGPGYVAAAAASRGAEAIGVDISEAMVDEARRRYPSLEFRRGEAESLPFPDASFDRVVSSFGVLHMGDPEAFFREARRVLRPGGRLGFTAWADPEDSPGARLIERAIETHAVPAPDLPQGPWDLFGGVQSCGRALVDAGFVADRLSSATVTRSWRVPSARHVFEAERDAGVRTAALLARQTEERLAAIADTIERGMTAWAVDGGYAVPMAAHVIVASI